MTNYTAGAVTLVASKYAPTYFASSAIALEGGGYIVFYERGIIPAAGPDFANTLFAQIYDASGVKVGTELSLTSADGNYHQLNQQTPLADGGFLLSWSTNSADYSVYTVSEQRFDAAGNKVGDETHLGNSYFGISATQRHDGNYDMLTTQFVVNPDSTYSTNIFTQVFDSSMTPQGTAVQVSTDTAHSKGSVIATELVNGGQVVVWINAGDGFQDAGLYSQVLDSTGARIGSETQVNTQTVGQHFNLHVAALKDGGFIAVWETLDFSAAHASGLSAQRFDALGNKVGEETRIFANNQASHSPLVTALNDGGYAIAWSGYDDGFTTNGVYTQRYDVTGAKAGDVVFIDHILQPSALTTLENGSIVLEWNNHPGLLPADTQEDIYTATFTPDMAIYAGDGFANSLAGVAGQADQMFGLGGDDTYRVDNAGDLVTEQLDQGTDTVKTNVAGYTLGANVENLIQVGAGNINGTGNELDNYMIGNGANNTLTGGQGDDTLAGGKGNDVLIGGTGNDRMIGGDGNDTYYLGNGDTVIEAANGGIDLVITALATTHLGATLENITLVASALNADGNGLNNVMTGNQLNNVLQGGNGADTIDGRSGADTLNGGGGADHLHGGLGADVFVYRALADSAVGAMDFIDDMIGADKFDFHLIDANVHVAGDQAFHLVNAFTHHEAELVLSYDSGANQTTVLLDANGDMKADMAILVVGHLTSTAGWLL